ncbi:hypothetical protein HUT16_17415 [Kitasatospora sp. NA04385]|uniref:hypothetical protein n=1 Tax=Kitasatospora sp. NA04385 TaxID=2742135 RepID=UPI00158FFBBC|nr:hypothetical protein [Kitasatospora sp. NA04385]QKW20612.1 hypothetical protein HUT16_17415 [Kitasatospora sp. NA04385]
MTSPTLSLPGSAASDLAADLAEESEQVQALAHALGLPPTAPDGTRLLSRHLLATLVHLATATATAAALVDLTDAPALAHLRPLSSITSALSGLLAANAAMVDTLHHLAAEPAAAEAAGLLRTSRGQAAALLTSASAHLGTAAAQLRPPLVSP